MSDSKILPGKTFSLDALETRKLIHATKRREELIGHARALAALADAIRNDAGDELERSVRTRCAIPLELPIEFDAKTCSVRVLEPAHKHEHAALEAMMKAKPKK